MAPSLARASPIVKALRSRLFVRSRAGRSTVATEHGEITLVAPNGAQRQEKYRPHDKVVKVLGHAVKEFGKEGALDPDKDYVLTFGGTKLEDGQTLEQVGVEPGATLHIRSKKKPQDGYAS